MPAVQALKDDCLTAEDVRRKAAEVARRRASLRAIPVRHVRATIVPPAPVPVDMARLRVVVHFGYPLIPVESYKAFRMKTIQKACCRAADISMGEMLSQARQMHLVRVRDVAILLCRMIGPSDTSMPMIGRHFGGRDHTTVLHSLRKTECIREALVRRVKDGAPLEEYVSAAFDGWDEFIRPHKEEMAAKSRQRTALLPRNERGDWMKK